MVALRPARRKALRAAPRNLFEKARMLCSLYQRLFARALALGDHAQDAVYGARKRALFADLEGTVLEIGPGTGVNLPYLPGGLRWIGVEPNPHLHRTIREKAAARPDLDVELRTGSAAALDLPDGSVDAVVSTLVLCSVSDVSAALAEIRRVLKPGGRFLFIEHVAAPSGSGLRAVQRVVKPLWRPLADGCSPDRETGRAIEAAGFADVHIEHFRAEIPFSPITPHILGSATR